MSFASYWSAFRQVWSEDRQFAYLGPRRLSLLAMHYRGRCEARFDLLPKVGTEYLKHFSRMIDLTFSAPYLVALEGVFLDVNTIFRCVRTTAAPYSGSRSQFRNGGARLLVSVSRG